MFNRFNGLLVCVCLIVCYAVNGYALNKVEAPEYFPKSDIGRPVSGGEVYIGEVDTDPTVVANQKQVYVQEEDGDIIAIDQPIDTSAGGVFEYNGSPVIILVDGDYSMTVTNSAGSQVYYTPSNLFSESEGAIIPGAYYYPDYRAADQTIDSGNTVTFASIDTDTGTDKITIYCRNNDPDGETDYTFLNNFTLDERITLEFENGAMLVPASGVTVKVNDPDNITATQPIFDGDGSIVFEEEGDINAIWFYDGADLGLALTDAIGAASNNFFHNNLFVPTGDYTISTPVDATELAHTSLCYSSIDFRDARINLETTGQPTFDFTGSSMIWVFNGYFNGDDTNTPSSAFLFAPSSVRTNSLQYHLKNVNALGHYSKATVTAIGVAPLYIDNQTTLENQDGITLSHTRRNSGSEASVYSTIATLPQDSNALYTNNAIYFNGTNKHPIIDLEGNFNHCSLTDLYMQNGGVNSPYIRVDVTAESNSQNIQITNPRTEGIAPTSGVSIVGTNSARVFISGGEFKVSDNIIECQDGTIRANVGWPVSSTFGTGRDIDVKNVDYMVLNMLSGINPVRVDGTITSGILAYTNTANTLHGSLGALWDLSGATNAERLTFIDLQNPTYYEWVEEFDFDLPSINIGSWPGSFWTRGGVNSAVADIVIASSGGGSVSITASGADNDATNMYGAAFARSTDDPIFESSFSINSVSDIYFAVGLTEGAYSIAGSEDDDCVLVTLNTDSGQTTWQLTTNDNGAGVEYIDTGIQATTSVTIIKLDTTDTEDVRVWIDNTEIDVSGANIQAGTSMRPFVMAITQDSGGSSRSATVNSMSFRQDL